MKAKDRNNIPRDNASLFKLFGGPVSYGTRAKNVFNG